MTVLKVLICGVSYDIRFTTQKRVERNITHKDTMCFGLASFDTTVGDGGKTTVYAYAPAIAYQGDMENYKREFGEHLALERFIERNGIDSVARPAIWTDFLEAWEEEERNRDLQRLRAKIQGSRDQEEKKDGVSGNAGCGACCTQCHS